MTTYKSSNRKNNKSSDKIDFNDYLIFDINSQQYAINTLYVKEIIDKADITPVPRSDSSVVGIMVHRGKAIPVIDTETFIDVKTTTKNENSKRKFIMCEFGDKDVAVSADSVTKLMRVTSTIDAPEMIKSDVLNGFIVDKENGEADKKIITILDINSFIDESKKARINE